MTSVQYFIRFGDDNVFKNISYPTNLYSMEQTGKLVDETNEKKLKPFLVYR